MPLYVCAGWNRCVYDLRNLLFRACVFIPVCFWSDRASFAHVAPIHEGSRDIICELRCLEYAVSNTYVSRCSTRQALAS